MHKFHRNATTGPLAMCGCQSDGVAKVALLMR